MKLPIRTIAIVAAVGGAIYLVAKRPGFATPVTDAIKRTWGNVKATVSGTDAGKATAVDVVVDPNAEDTTPFDEVPALGVSALDNARASARAGFPALLTRTSWQLNNAPRVNFDPQ